MSIHLRMWFFVQLYCLVAPVFASASDDAWASIHENFPARFMRTDGGQGQMNLILNHAGVGVQERRDAGLKQIDRLPEDGFSGNQHGGASPGKVVPHTVKAVHIKVVNHDYQEKAHKDHGLPSEQHPEWQAKTGVRPSMNSQPSKWVRNEVHDFEHEEAEDVARFALDQVHEHQEPSSASLPVDVTLPMNAFPPSTQVATPSNLDMLQSPSTVKDTLIRKFKHSPSQPAEGFHPFPNVFGRDESIAPPSQPGDSVASAIVAANVPAPSPEPKAVHDQVDTAIGGAGQQGIRNLDGTISDDPVAPPQSPSPHPSPTPLAQ